MLFNFNVIKEVIHEFTDLKKRRKKLSLSPTLSMPDEKFVTLFVESIFTVKDIATTICNAHALCMIMLCDKIETCCRVKHYQGDQHLIFPDFSHVI